MAFVGTPVEVAIDSGRAKKARYARLLPSIKKSCSGTPLRLYARAVCARLAGGSPGHKIARAMAPTPSAQYSVTLRVEIDHVPGMLGKVASAIGQAGGTIGAVDMVQVQDAHTIRDITVETGDASDWPRLSDAVNAVPG